MNKRVFVSRTLRAYFVGLVLMGVAGVLTVLIVSYITLLRSGGYLAEQLAERDARAPFELLVIRSDGSTVPLHIDAGASGCSSIMMTVRIQHACELATYIDPITIASYAYGRINYEDTDAFIALTWRARLDADATGCETGGLAGYRLTQCRDTVDSETLDVDIGDTVVRVPRG